MEERVTEKDSNYRHLEKMELIEILISINREDQTVPIAIFEVLPQIESLTKAVVQCIKNGGRLFYIGAGTSGRLGILDASECPPTFGVEPGLVVGIIAGGDQAIRKAVEFAEDDLEQGWEDLLAHQISNLDVVIGIAASGTTPYVIAAIKKAKAHGIATGSIVCNQNSELAAASDYPVEINVGPEFITGSTRMKSGTAQKLVLNMISTATMIQLGRIEDNKMVDMIPTNHKLIARGVKMIMNQKSITAVEAEKLLLKYGSVRLALEHS